MTCRLSRPERCSSVRSLDGEENLREEEEEEEKRHRSSCLVLECEKKTQQKPTAPSVSFGRRKRSWQRFRTFVGPFRLPFPSTAQLVVFTRRLLAETDPTQSPPQQKFVQNFTTFESSVYIRYPIHRRSSAKPQQYVVNINISRRKGFPESVPLGRVSEHAMSNSCIVV